MGTRGSRLTPARKGEPRPRLAPSPWVTDAPHLSRPSASRCACSLPLKRQGRRCVKRLASCGPASGRLVALYENEYTTPGAILRGARNGITSLRAARQKWRKIDYLLTYPKSACR